MSKKVLPHHPQDTESSAARLTRHHVELARIRVDGNDPVSPKKLIDWLENLHTTGWTKLRVVAYTEPGDEFNLENNYVVVIGDRLETDEEYKERQEEIIAKWQRDYEDYLRIKYFYECETGQARIQEIEQKKKRPINYPIR